MSAVLAAVAVFVGLAGGGPAGARALLVLLMYPAAAIVFLVVSMSLRPLRHVSVYRDDSRRETLLRVRQDQRVAFLTRTYTVLTPAGALPIAFDGLGRLEVDLLCDDARLAVELDGAQHLADPAAYRRDRRKDQLLQENGYFVLRFLAEDVGKELDLVLDTILRSLSHRRAMSSTTQIIRISRRTPA